MNVRYSCLSVVCVLCVCVCARAVLASYNDEHWMKQAPGSVNQGHSATTDEAAKILLNVQQGKRFIVPTCHRTSLALARQLTDGGNELVHVAL